MTETAQLVLMHAGAVIDCRYTPCNGGRTRSAAEEGLPALPYYRRAIDPWDAGAQRAAAAQGKPLRKGAGLGLSIAGACYAAQLGEDFEDILAFYYPGAEIVYYPEV